MRINTENSCSVIPKESIVKNLARSGFPAQKELEESQKTQYSYFKPYEELKIKNLHFEYNSLQPSSPCAIQTIEPKSSQNKGKILDQFPQDVYYSLSNYLTPTELIKLGCTSNTQNKMLKEVAILKPGLLMDFTLEEVATLYKNPANWQDKFVPQIELGRKYLENKGRIFSHPLIIKLIIEGRISIEEAEKLKLPPKMFYFFNNPIYKGVEKYSGVQKYLLNNKLSLQKALTLTKAEANILSKPEIQKYIDLEKMSIEDATTKRVFTDRVFQTIVLTCVMWVTSSFSFAALSLTIAPFLAGLSALVIGLFFLGIDILLFIPSIILANIIMGIKVIIDKSNFISFCQALFNYPSSRIYPVLKLELYRKGVQKYIEKGVLKIKENSLEEDNNAHIFTTKDNPKNLDKKAIQRRIDKNQISITEALEMNVIKVWTIEVLDFIKELFK